MATAWTIYPDFAGGCDCYYNTETGVATWTRPSDLPPLDYGLQLSAGGHAHTGQREGGGSKELETGSGTESSEYEEEDDDAYVAIGAGASALAQQLCEQREAQAESHDDGESKVVDTSGGPKLVWVPVPAPTPLKTTSQQTSTRKASSNKSKKTAKSGGGNKKVELVKWEKPAPEAKPDEAEGVWRYHEYDVGDKDDKVKVVAKWVVRNKSDDSEGYKTQDGIDVVYAGLDAVTLGALQATTEDLTQLDSLDDALIMFHLQQRFAQHKIYTNIGPIVVSINPGDLAQTTQHKNDAETQETRQRAEYREAHDLNRKDVAPHVFNTAERVYANATSKGGKKQAIIISGESGSGKTFTTKMMLRYIMERASDGGHNDIATKITNMNTVLEAFGNAKTRNNDNSSRFGKYLQLFLNDAGAIVGAKTDTYLLEKVRVVRRDPNERNYHIFYMMLAGIDETLSQRLHLDSKETFTYLSTQGQPPKTLDDATEFRKLEAALDSFGISGQVRENLYKVLAAIILCGQIEIVDKEGAAVIDSDDEFLHHVAELLGIGAQDLAQCICTSRVQAAGASVTLSARTAARAKNALDTMSKYMYGHVFDYLVRSMNKSTAAKDETHIADGAKYIGFLDIFGFEKMTPNSLEQLCINYANEELQNLFNDSTFQQEMEVYKQEQVDVGDLNKPTESQTKNATAIGGISEFLQHLDNKVQAKARDVNTGGICNDEEAYNSMRDLTDENFKAAFELPLRRTDNLQFTVHHYAADIKYTMTDFCAKSKDELDDFVADTLRTGSVFVKELVPGPPNVDADASLGGGKNVRTGGRAGGGTGRAGGGTGRASGGTGRAGGGTGRASGGTGRAGGGTGRASGGTGRAGGGTGRDGGKQSLGLKFRNEVAALIAKLREADQHYVRCVKSNAGNDPWTFHAATCYTQLKYAGVFQALQLQVRGFPFHTTIGEFVNMYGVIVEEYVWPPSTTQTAANDFAAARNAAISAYSAIAENNTKAVAIKDYVLSVSVPLRRNFKDRERIRHGKSMMLYCGTWHRALETLREPAQKRADLRARITQLVGDTLDSETQKYLSLAVLEAKRTNPPLFPTENTTLTDAIAKVQRYAQSKLTPEMLEDLKAATTKSNTEELAKLVQQCSDAGLVAVPEVDAAYNLLCNLVQLEDELEEAVGNKDEQALTKAIARAERFKGYDSDLLARAQAVNRAMRTIADEAHAACRDGIKAHGDAVLDAARNVQFTNEDTVKDFECLRNMNDEQRLQKAIETGNLDEAVRIKSNVDRNDEGVFEAPSRLLKTYLDLPDMAVVVERFPERQVFAEDVPVDLPPFTNLARGTTDFQARLLDQAAVDNFDTVGKFLQGDATVEQLDELFTSCFMHECLRDELFIAIHKKAGLHMEGDAKACQLVQLALGHFGPSEKLHDFVYSLVGHCHKGLKLVGLLFRRQVCEEVLKRITDTFDKFKTPNYEKEAWFKALAEARQVLNPST